MKIVSTILVFLLTVSNAQTVCEIDGRKGLRFGMTFEETRNVNLEREFPTINEILAYEPGLTEEELINNYGEETINSLLSRHKTTFAGNSATGHLFFANDRLYSIIYIFNITTSNKNKYIDIYYELKGMLTKKYSEPTRTIEYLSGSYEDDFPRGNYAGQAISLGKGEYVSMWKCPTNKKSVILSLTGDNYEITLDMHYSDQSFDLTEKEKESKALDDF